MKNHVPFKKGLWIWHSPEAIKDDHAEFLDFFEYSGGKVECFISCHDEYALFINGRFVETNQYSDFDHYKVYDRIDLSPFLQIGKNTFALSVWYCGGHSMRFSPSVGGVVFEIADENENILLYSSKDTPSRQSLAYVSGRRKVLTSQLGYTFLYDSTKEDSWKTGNGSGFCSSSESSLEPFTFFERPIKKAVHLSPIKSKITQKSEDGCHYTVDLGAEAVGLFTMKLRSGTNQLLTIEYGEDLKNGHVRRKIGQYDFHFEYIASEGENEYTNYFLRLGCRFIEIYSESPIELEYATVIPQVYPTKVRKYRSKGELEGKIYDICVNTLNLCMMEHYVDCPWREQGLYTFDSRNQMLFGYYAFEDKNFDYARANLLLMSKDNREDDLLSICFPCNSSLAIPSFSLHYFTAIEEYTRYSGDVSLAKEIYGKLVSIMNVFLGNMKDGLVYDFGSHIYWNFYDWTKDLEGQLCRETIPTPDCVLNCLTVRALDTFKTICEYIDMPFPYEGKAETLRKNILESFYRPEVGLFSMHTDKDTFNVLSNVLAVLAGIVAKEDVEALCDRFLSADIIDCTLSLKAFKYDALLMANFEKYRDRVLNEIKIDYEPMVKAGATSAWETADGPVAFGGAGSLCHGWSAAPIYYYHKLGIIEGTED